MIWRGTFLALVLLGTLAPAPPASAAGALCDSSNEGVDVASAIAACTARLQETSDRSTKALLYYHRGSLYHRAQDISNAIKDLNESLSLDGSSANTFVARALVRLESPSEIYLAESDITTALLISPTYDRAIKAAETVKERLRSRGMSSFLDSPFSPLRDSQQNNKERQNDNVELPEVGKDSFDLSDLNLAQPEENDPFGFFNLPLAQPPQEKRVALVIGNSAYQNVPRLPNPVNDATDVAAALERVGFSVQRETDLDFNGLRRALRDFGEKASGADMAVVFFAGHGIELSRQNYVIPVDAQLRNDRDVALEAIPVEQLLSATEEVRGLRLVLLDACRNNPFVPAMKLTSANRSIGRGLSRINPPGGTMVAFAAQEGTIAADGDGRNSPFSAAFLSLVEQPGLELGLLLRKMRDQVMQATDQQQEPFTYGALGGDPIYFVPPKQ